MDGLDDNRASGSDADLQRFIVSGFLQLPPSPSVPHHKCLHILAYGR